MEIVDFLMQRIAEDEAAANKAAYPRPAMRGDLPNAMPGVEDFVVDYGPYRVLAECAAKRAIINHHEYDHIDGAHLCQDSMVDDDQCEELRALAAVYADHPDYDEAWA